MPPLPTPLRRFELLSPLSPDDATAYKAGRGRPAHERLFARSRSALIILSIVSSASARTFDGSSPASTPARWASSFAAQVRHFSTSHVRSSGDSGRCSDSIKTEQPWRNSARRFASAAGSSDRFLNHSEAASASLLRYSAGGTSRGRAPGRFHPHPDGAVVTETCGPGRARSYRTTATKTAATVARLTTQGRWNQAVGGVSGRTTRS